MSSDKEKPWFKKIRRIWDRRPAEHVKKNDKVYSRKKNKKILDDEKAERNEK